MHGLREFPVRNVRSLDFVDEPLPEAKEEHNQVIKSNAKLGDKYNDFQMKICCLLDDKIFLAQSLNFVASKLTGIKVHNTRTELEPTYTAQGMPSSEMKKIIKTTLRDASLAYQNDIETLSMLNRFLINQTFSQPKDYPKPDTPELLYHAFKGECRSRHSQDLGFHSSNQPLTPPSYHNALSLTAHSWAKILGEINARESSRRTLLHYPIVRVSGL